MNVFESRIKEIDSMKDRVMDLKEETFVTILGMIAKAAVVATTSKINVDGTKSMRQFASFNNL